jgi:hypothetical protein
MAAKRLLIPCALMALSMITGCRTWCERHYPCQQPQPVLTQQCVPCCPPGVNGVSQVPPPPPTQPVNFGSSRMDCVCTPSR